tara:strand:+ start:105 stop:344 length:240 start_codon:yes stop_codon:yes gene_type:complete
MKCKRRYMHGKRLRRSPIKNNYPTRDFSAEATKDTLGSKLVARIVPPNTPAGIFSAVLGGGILRNAPKIFKAAKTFLTS